MPGSSSIPWWLATTSCSPPPASSLPDGLAFLFLSPCPQRALLGAVDLLFLLAALALSLRARLLLPRSSRSTQDEEEPLLAKPAPRRGRRSFRHRLALAASTALASGSLVLLALALLKLLSPRSGADAARSAVQCAAFLAHLAAAGTVAAEKAAAAARAHPAHLRLFWLATAALGALFSGSAAARYAFGEPVLPDDPIAFAGFALSLPLLYFAVEGSTGLGADAAAAAEERNGTSSDHAAAATTSAYATASWLSLATFSWINPLIAKGSRAALGDKDVPPVAPADTAEAAYALFVSNWPAPAPGSKAGHPVATALLRSFWPQFLLTAALGVAHLSVMYIDPSLVDRFVQFVRRGGDMPEGLQLVAILLAGKAAETLASHHYEFQGQKLGMRIHAALKDYLCDILKTKCKVFASLFCNG